MSATRLTDLIKAYGLPAEYDRGASDLPVKDVTADSRTAAPGTVFVAVPGVKADGRAFIPDAIAHGASAIVSQDYTDAKVPCVKVANPRLALARFAAALYAPQPSHMVGITGTDGKTSSAEFFRQLAAMCHYKAASIGTLGMLGEHRALLAPGMNTTPDPVALHRTLQKLAKSGYSYAAMEASSHGLQQYRLDGVLLLAGAFTNLTRDHLDYHGTEEAYFAAKARLFSELLPVGATAVLNADDPRIGALKALCGKRSLRCITFGTQGAELRIVGATPHPGGQHAELEIFGTKHAFDLPHVGAFQVYNMLTALGLLSALGENPQTLAKLLPRLSGVPGRMERVASISGAAAYIDYAHTPAALENALKVARAHTPKRLIVVFGCGGERDKGKRPLMGRAAATLADVAIVTDDNPRGEDASAIRAEVMAEAKGAKEVADRRAAIYGAVKMLAPGDVLLVAGKGHEKTQIIAGVEHPFDDAQVIRDAVAAL